MLFLGDGDAAVAALAAHDRDPILKALRHEGAFDAILAANDAFAAWHEVLRPTSSVHCLGAFDNRVRALVDDQQPIVLGLQLRAGLEGRPLPSNVPDVELPEGHPITAQQLEHAADLDPELFRVLTRASVMLDDERHLESPAVAARVLEVLDAAGHESVPADRPAVERDLDDRAFLEQLLAAYA